MNVERMLRNFKKALSLSILGALIPISWALSMMKGNSITILIWFYFLCDAFRLFRYLVEQHKVRSEKGWKNCFVNGMGQRDLYEFLCRINRLPLMFVDPFWASSRDFPSWKYVENIFTRKRLIISVYCIIFSDYVS